MNKSKTVILWGREDVLGRSVELFLKSRSDWEVVRILDHQGIEVLLAEMERVQPDVVMIYQGNYTGELPMVDQLLQGRPGIKIITISLENNVMEVYNMQKIKVKEVADLFSVVEG